MDSAYALYGPMTTAGVVQFRPAPPVMPFPPAIHANLCNLPHAYMSIPTDPRLAHYAHVQQEWPHPQAVEKQHNFASTNHSQYYRNIDTSDRSMVAHVARSRVTISTTH